MKGAIVLLLTALLQAGESTAWVQSSAEVQVSVPASARTCVLRCHGFMERKCRTPFPAAREQVKAAGPFIGPWLFTGAFVQGLLLEEVNLWDR